MAPKLKNKSLEALLLEFNKNPNVNLMEKNFIDLNFLSEIKPKSYDWVLISHALSTVFEKNIEETLNLRRKLVSEFVRIANKGLLPISTVSSTV